MCFIFRILLLSLFCFFDGEKKMKDACQQWFQTFIELPVESLNLIHAVQNSCTDQTL